MHTRRVFKPHFLENYAPPRESCCSCLVSGYVISSVSRFLEILIAPEIDRHRSITIINHRLINADLELRYSACLVKSCNNLRDKVLFLFRRRILEERRMRRIDTIEMKRDSTTSTNVSVLASWKLIVEGNARN